MSRLPIVRVPSTATSSRSSPSEAPTSSLTAAAETKVTPLGAIARPKAPNIGR